MNYQEAKTKASQKIEASNGDPKAYEIPFEMAESIKGMVGKKYSSSKGTIEVIEWTGQNFVVKFDGDNYQVTPARYYAMCVQKGAVVEIK